MSLAAAKWARAQDLPRTEKAVLRALADAYSPRWGRSEVTQAAMANELGLARETVNRTLFKLEARGLIAIGTAPRKKGQWDRRVYTLAIGTEAKAQPHRVTQDHMAPCDSNQTRHRVTQDHTSRRDVAPDATKNVFSGAALSFAEKKTISEATAERLPHRLPDDAGEVAGPTESERPSVDTGRGPNLRKPPAGRSAGASLVTFERMPSQEIFHVDLSDTAQVSALAERAIAERRRKSASDEHPIVLTPDATKLLAVIRTEGPMAPGMGPRRMGWGAIRFWRAGQELLRLGRTRINKDGHTIITS